MDFCRGRARVIAVNDAFRVAPWAEVMYACDAKFWYWHWHKGARDFAGLKFSIDPAAKRYRGVTVLRKTGDTGLERDPSGLRAGRNSGYQAINLAVHLGAVRIVLLGYDMRGDGKGDHFFGAHPDSSKPPFPVCLQRFATLVDPLRAAAVEVINCTRRTALTVFPCRPLESVWSAPVIAPAPAEALPC
ncbi:MAG TPA: hypothetical protein VM243_07390 [Phycisphaerae bacterium]|nr:hypothetical protein [Phycisphaerae bacterium]